MVNRAFEGKLLAPLLGRSSNAVRSDLIQPPVNLEAMAVRIAELDRNLRAGASSPLEHDLDVVLLEVRARKQHLRVL